MQSDDAQAVPRYVSRGDLFLGFLKIGMLGFGGVAPWARHIIVEERRWVTDREFAEIIGIGQVLPGPNTMNAAVIIGDRFQGLTGALLCVLGQILAPLIIVTSLGVAYAQYAHVPMIAAAVVGAAAAAAGLVMGTGLKMLRKIKLAPFSLLITAAAFLAVGILNWPLVPVVAVLVPVSIAGAALERKA